MFDTREKCVNCLVDFTVFWGDVEKKTGKREHYATSKPVVHTKDGWLCAKCAENGKCWHENRRTN